MLFPSSYSHLSRFRRDPTSYLRATVGVFHLVFFELLSANSDTSREVLNMQHGETNEAGLQTFVDRPVSFGRS